MSSAARQRRRRARQRAGRRVYSVEADAAAIEDALTALGYLHPLRADDPKAVERALAALIERTCSAVTRDAADI